MYLERSGDENHVRRFRAVKTSVKKSSPPPGSNGLISPTGGQPAKPDLDPFE
jgi:hypothetical protein